MTRGKLIVIEGMDGAGKKTQARLLQDHIDKSYIYSFPTPQSSIYPLIESGLVNDVFNPETLALLMSANRYEFAPDINDDLHKGHHVICDRYWQSNLVYGTARNINSYWLEQLDGLLPQPDVVFVLLIDPKTRRRKPADMFESDRKLTAQVHELYHEFARNYGWIIIDAEQSINAVHQQIVDVVDPLIAEA